MHRATIAQASCDRNAATPSADQPRSSADQPRSSADHPRSSALHPRSSADQPGCSADHPTFSFSRSIRQNRKSTSPHRKSPSLDLPSSLGATNCCRGSRGVPARIGSGASRGARALGRATATRRGGARPCAPRGSLRAAVAALERSALRRGRDQRAARGTEQGTRRSSTRRATRGRSAVAQAERNALSATRVLRSQPLAAHRRCARSRRRRNARVSTV